MGLTKKNRNEQIHQDLMACFSTVARSGDLVEFLEYLYKSEFEQQPFKEMDIISAKMAYRVFEVMGILAYQPIEYVDIEAFNVAQDVVDTMRSPTFHVKECLLETGREAWARGLNNLNLRRDTSLKEMIDRLPALNLGLD